MRASVSRAVVWFSIFSFLIAPAAPVHAGEDASVLAELNQGNWQAGETLLPPEVLDHYKKGEWINPVVPWPQGLSYFAEDFLRGTEENGGRLTLDERGTIIDKVSGQQPSYIIGFPFPDIDPRDPHAAIKIIWNYYYQFWNNGNIISTAILNWVSASSFERSAVQDTFFLYYDAQSRELSPEDNPRNLLYQFLSTTVEPADLYGTAALAWRFRDGDKRDKLWAYVPALRRVREVSPSNRSDGFLGSDLSQDDGPFFDGKPQDFTWKLIGEAEMLRLTDPYSLRRDVQVEKLPEGGWRTYTKDVPRIGFQLPAWKGVAYAPLSLALAKRKMWVIEAVPKDRYYLYGRIQLYIDKETFEGTWNRKFDWKGELLHLLVNGRGMKQSPDGKTYFDSSPVAVILAENIRLRRATVAGPPEKNVPFTRNGVSLDPGRFEYQELLRVGK